MDLVEFARVLLERTANGRADWEVAGDDSYAIRTDQAIVVIRSRDSDGRHPFILELFDRDQSLAEDLHSGWVDNVPNAWNQALMDLYDSARRAAFNVDDLMESILEATNGDD